MTSPTQQNEDKDIASPSDTAAKPIDEVQPLVAQHGLIALAKYMTRTEVHTYAFSVAANAILSLFPFIVLLLTVSRGLFHSRAMEGIVGDMMKNFLPTGQDFVMRNMQLLAHPRKGTQWFSLVMLLITSTGVFLPLEVALNAVWGVKENRSYLRNQLVSLGLAFGVGVLAMVSVAGTAAQRSFLAWMFLGHTDGKVFLLCAVWTSALPGFAVRRAAVLFYLLGAAEPEGSGAGCAAYGDRDGAAVGTGEVCVYSGAAVAGFSVDLWAVLYFGGADDVGVSVGTSAAGWSAFFCDAVYAATGSGGGGEGEG